MTVTRAEPSEGTLIAEIFSPADYRDAFTVATPAGRYDRIEAFTTDYFMNQPAWLTLVSMNTTSKAKLRAAIGNQAYEPGTRIGSWKIHARNETELVFGDDMGFMEYRFSLRYTPTSPDLIEASTAVRYKWRRTGRFYFAVVRPAHKRFVARSLRSALRDQ